MIREKVTVSIECLSGCSGCEVGIIDLHEKLLTVLEEIDLKRIPMLMDTKDYVKADVGIITGSVRTCHDRDAAQRMREECDSIIAFGTCAVYGGPQGAAYAHTNEELFHDSYTNNPTTQTTTAPANVPALLEEIKPLGGIIPVDLYLTGCPPHPAFIFESLMALVRNRNPQIGRYNVCYNCTRTMKKSQIESIKRMSGIEGDASTCFLSQGTLCFGSVTLDRCQAPCPNAGIPCFSCGGPSESVILEPQKDVRSEVAARMAHLTKIPYTTIVGNIEQQAKTYFAYAMASPVFRQKPTFLLKKWMQKPTVSPES
jgi:F420-non-reducing hydrogenase small subunit